MCDICAPHVHVLLEGKWWSSWIAPQRNRAVRPSTLPQLAAARAGVVASSGIGSEGAHLLSCCMWPHALVISAYLRQNVSVSDCRKLATNFEKVKKADELMLAVRAMLKEQVGDFLQIAGLVKAVGPMDMCICGMILSLKQKDEKQHGTAKLLNALPMTFALWPRSCLGCRCP